MKRSVYQLLLIITSAIAIQPINAQPAECTVLKSFAVNPNTELNISNKFGDVTLINSNVDSVTICATASVEYPDSELAGKSLTLISLDVSLSNNTITCVTAFNEKFFSSQFSKGRKSFNVNYIIKTPHYINVTINNSFGNVKIEELSGRADITVAHGSFNSMSLTRGNEKPVNRIVLKHSKASIGYANWMGMELYHSPQIEIGIMQAISLVSEFSVVKIDSVNSLVINSKSDNYLVRNLARGVIEAALSTIEISSLTDILRVDAAISTIKVGRVEEGFGEVNLSGNSSVFIIGIPQDSPYRISAISRGAATIIVPDVDRKYLSKESSVPGVFIVSGFGGEGKETNSAINADMKSGKLELFHTKR